MNELTFAQPEWLWVALLLLPALALRIRAHRSATRQLGGLVSPKLTSQLINGSSRSQRWIVFFLRSLAVIGILGALARPQLGFDEIESEVEARNLILAIDTSRSMLAVDLSPDRLTRAKLAAKDIILSLPEDRIGLIAFAGRPFLQAPLTVDHEAILESIDQLDTEIIPRGGTNLAAAARLALETAEEADLEGSSLVIFSDGEALEGDPEIERVRADAAEAGMAIISVGVGTLDGSIIPEMDRQGQRVPGVFLKNDEGQVVRSRLNPEALQALSAERGAYTHLDGQSSLSQVVQQIQTGIATSREESESRLRPIERFMWPLSVALFVLLLSHIAPLFWLKPRHLQSNWATVTSTSSLILFALLAPLATVANDALFLGHEAFLEDDYQAAIRTFEGALSEKVTERDRTRLQMGIGAASYRNGDYERAAEAYGQALLGAPPKIREHAFYNLGNTLFRQGETALNTTQSSQNPDQLQSLAGADDAVASTIRRWETAIEHFESALALNRENEEASHNLEVVRKRLEELKQEQQEQEQQNQQEQDQQQDQNEEGGENSDQQNQDQSQNQENQGNKENQPESEEEEQSEEEQESEGDNQQQQDSPPENQPGEDEQEENQEGSDSEEDQQEAPEQDSGGQKDNESPPQQSSRQEPEQPEAPQEGDLQANSNQAPPSPQPSTADPREVQVNPETGYSPSEARQLLEALADETEVRPVLLPSGNETYKDW
ncbi:MAG: VWA domain-containing protein [Verrucomicrobiota bacterium]